jgi:flagellar biosynthesis protein FliR
MLLLKAVSVSLVSTPPGQFITDFGWASLLRQAGVSFSFGLALAAPVMLMLLLSDIAMGVFARSMPQLNVFVLGFAVKIVLGVAGLAYSMRFLEMLFSELFSNTFLYWQKLAS